MSNVIAAGNIQLGMNANGLYAEAKRVQSQMRALRQVVKETANPKVELAQKQALLVKAFKDGQFNAGELARRVETLRAKYGEVNQGQINAAASAERLAAAQKRLAQSTEDARRAKEAQNRAMQTVMRETSNPQADMAKDFKAKEALLIQAFRQGQMNASELTRRMELLRQKYDVVNQGQVNATESANRLAAAKKRLADATDQARIKQEQHNKALVEEAIRQSRVSAATMAAVNAKQGGLRGNVINAASMAGAGNLASLASMGARAGVVAGVAMGAVESLKAASAAERANTSFAVLLGSMDKANRMVQQMRAISASSPIRLTDLQDSAKTMLAFGVTGDRIIPTLKQIGDITGGDSQRFQMLSLAFAQMSAAGRLMGQDLLQMVNAGFNPLQEISRATGLSLVDLKKRMEDGQISSQMVAEAFARATGEGGRFNGMLESQRNTLGGKWSQMLAQLQALGVTIGEGLAPVGKILIDVVGGALKVVGFLAQKLVDGLSIIGRSIYDIANGDFGFSSTNELLKSIAERNSQLEQGTSSVRKQQSAIDSLIGSQKSLTDETQKQVEASKRLYEQYDSISEANRKRIDTLQFGELEANTRERKRNGMTDIMVENLANQERMISRLEREKKLRDESIESAKKLSEEGKALSERFQSPAEKLKKEIAGLMRLLSVGAIDKRTFEMASMAAAKDMRQQKGESEGDGLVRSIQAGTQEAYKLLVSRGGNGQEKKLEDIRAVNQAILIVNRDMATSIKNIPGMEVYR